MESRSGSSGGFVAGAPTLSSAGHPDPSAGGGSEHLPISGRRKASDPRRTHFATPVPAGRFESKATR